MEVSGATVSGEEQVDYLLFAQSIDLTPAGKLGVLLKEEGKENEPGRVRISGISPHGLAGKAGLEAEDRILTLDGQPVMSIVDIKISLLDKKAGEVVRLEIMRDQEQLNVPVELSESPAAMALPPDHPGK